MSLTGSACQVMPSSNLFIIPELSLVTSSSTCTCDQSLGATACVGNSASDYSQHINGYAGHDIYFNDMYIVHSVDVISAVGDDTSDFVLEIFKPFTESREADYTLETVS